jgi:hypothetical protein
MMEPINTLIEKSRINPLTEISEPPTYCTINNKPTLTSGNFSLIYGKKKSGKTFLLGGVIASTINNSTQLEVIKGCLPEDKNVVLYFDTEQSPFHANRSVKRICKLTGNINPKNLLAFGLRPYSPDERLKVIEEVIATTPNIGIIAIDGIRDLLTTGINDEQEATKLTSRFLKWSSDLNLHIVLLLHQNKGDEHARGHIGSEIVNKAETTISVTKDDKNKIFKVVCEDSRDMPFDNFGFAITEEGLPIAADIQDYKPNKTTDPKFIKSEDHLFVLSELYKTGLDFNYADLTKALSEEFRVGVNASKKFITYYINNKWLSKERDGMSVNYKLNPVAQSFYWK